MSMELFTSFDAQVEAVQKQNKQYIDVFEDTKAKRKNNPPTYRTHQLLHQ